MSEEHGHKNPSLRMKAPSKEDLYFEQEDRKRIAKIKEERRKREEEEGLDKLKQAHWMCCPKCGHSLVEVEYHGVLIDQCTRCRGIFLDHGELEALEKRTASSVFDVLGFLRKK